MSFLTGSRVYGTPREDSDVDMVVMLDAFEMDILSKLADGDHDIVNGRPSSLRFGRLNLIVCGDQTAYDAWMDGTMNLREAAPVTREQAIEEFQDQGIHNPYATAPAAVA